MKKLLIPILALIFLNITATAYADTDTAGSTPAAFSSVKIQGDGQVISAGTTGSITTTTSLTTPTTLQTSPSAAFQRQENITKHKLPKKQSATIPRMQDNEQLQSAPSVGVVPEATVNIWGRTSYSPYSRKNMENMRSVPFRLLFIALDPSLNLSPLRLLPLLQSFSA